jgi:hypothetical protein
MNPEQEIELVLRVLSTRPTDEEIFHLEHEDVNPRKVEQEPEEKPEEEPVPLPVPVGGTLSSVTAQSVSFKKFRTHETTSSAPQRNGRLERSPFEECWCVDRSRLKCRGCAQSVRLGVGSWAVDFGQSSFTLKTLKSVLTFFPILPPAVMGTRCPVA